MHGVGGAQDACAPGRIEPVEHPGRGARRVDLDAALLREIAERGAEAVGRLDRHRVTQMAVEAGGQLAAVDEEGHRAVGLHNREGQRQRGVRHVAAANVKQPGNRFGHRQHRGRRAGIGQRLADARALVGGALAGKFIRLGEDRRQRRRRPPGPDLVERVVLHRPQGRAGALGPGAQPLDLLRRVQPRVIGDRVALLGRGGEPARPAARRSGGESRRPWCPPGRRPVACSGRRQRPPRCP